MPTPTLPTRYERNLEKIMQLKPEVQWAGIAWLNDCVQLGFDMFITEAYRTPKRQAEIYSWGRTKAGPDGTWNKKTWTLTSLHTLRLAVDVSNINCSYEDLEQVARRYGIRRNPILIKAPYFDLGHFELDQVGPLIPTKPKDPNRRLKELERRRQNTTNEDLKPLLDAEIKRLKDRIAKLPQ